MSIAVPNRPVETPASTTEHHVATQPLGEGRTRLECQLCGWNRVAVDAALVDAMADMHVAAASRP